ncbi:MAG: methyltransferase domain-containing protein [Alphaproteobacteria bacterium]|nr:methyltransferase domain-containing protein [Alphaproteobacteria bacterium]
MDRIYRWQVPIYDLTRKYYLIGRDALIAELDPAPGAAVLEIGCGTGRNLAHAARLHPQAVLFGLDISREMLARASETLRANAVLAVADAGDFDPAALFGRRTFDRVFVSYALSMIPDWRAALRRAFDVAAPGARVAIVDFGPMAGMPGPMRWALRRWLRAFSVEPRREFADAFAGMATQRGFRHRVDMLAGGYAVYARAIATS